jgi:hypothetical protein
MMKNTAYKINNALIKSYATRIRDISAAHYHHTKNALPHRPLGLPTRFARGLAKENKQHIRIAGKRGHVLRIHETDTTTAHRRDLRMCSNFIAVLNRRIFVERDMCLGAENLNRERIEFRLRNAGTTILCWLAVNAYEQRKGTYSVNIPRQILLQIRHDVHLVQTR